MQIIKKILKITATSLGLFFISTTFAHAETIKNFDSVIQVNTDGSVNVTETIVYDSEGLEKHGIFRDITPKSSTGQSMAITDVLVTDKSGNPYQWQRQNNGADIELKIGDPNMTFHGVKTYVIHYVAHNAVAQLKDIDEIYWNVTGNKWPFPIQLASARVVLPVGTKATQASCYVGFAGSTDSCGTTLQTTFSSPRSLAIGEGLTVAVGFPKGNIVIVPPTLWQKFGIVLLIAVFPILLFIGMYIRWKKYGRDPKGTGVIVPQYDVPDGLTPLEAGVIVFEKSRNKDISAELIYLATKGYLKIEDREEKILGFIPKKEYIFTLLKNPTELQNQFDRKILTRIFSDTSIGSSAKLSDLRDEFYSAVPGIFSSVGKMVLAKEYYKNLPHSEIATVTKSIVRSIALVVLVLLVPSIILPIIVSQFTSGTVLLVGAISLAISIVIFIIFQKLMPAKTEKGVATKEYLLGLKDYLQIAEKDRLNFHNAPDKRPEVFEMLLPYAMIFGVEKAWAKEFEGIYVNSPSWYVGQSGTFNAIYFANEMSLFSTAASGSLAATPSGGGSGGGGFSGGGGGGGGGGSW